MLTLHGIPNCDTIRKARKWLTEHDLDYTFHDYRKDGVPKTALKKWCAELGWEKVLNRRGTTWRKLDEKTKSSINQSKALQLMQEHPAMIKRPLLVDGDDLILGFKAEHYAEHFNV